MVVDVGGVHYTVMFQHVPDTEHSWGQGTTRCEIVWGKDPKNPDISIVATTHCSKKDIFTLARGQKEALAKALKKFPRNVRREFWKAYFSQCS